MCNHNSSNLFGMLSLVFLICLELVHGDLLVEDTSDLSAQLQPRFATPCTTPNGNPAFCVEIQSCPLFMNAIESGQNESFDFIRASQCSPANENTNRPKVCCGSKLDYDNKPHATTHLPPVVEDAPPPPPSLPAPKPPSKDPFPTTCGNQTMMLANRIVGGRITNLGEFPWMARLRHRRKDGLLTYSCGAFLIGERFAITAAHCINSTVLEPLGPIYQVQLGEHDTERNPDCTRFGKCSDEPQVLRTAKPIVHPEYSNDRNHYNDIAVIPLKQKAKFTEFVYPICLAKEFSDVRDLWLAGWGKTDTREKSPIKMKVAIPRSDHQRCADLYRMVNVKLEHSQFCAGGIAGRDSCSGDSGGPIMVLSGGTWYAEGVVSFGLGCGLENWPGVYTSIPAHLPWIKKVANRYLNNKNNRNKRNKKGKKSTKTKIRFV